MVRASERKASAIVQNGAPEAVVALPRDGGSNDHRTSIFRQSDVQELFICE